VTEEIQHLWSLRELDEQRIGLLAALGRFPAQRVEIESRLKNEHQRLDQLKLRVGDLQKARREREREVESAREQEKKFQSQLPSVRKNEEYTALLHEIEAVKSKRSEIETAVLMQMEEEDRILSEKPALEKALAAAEAEGAARRSDLDREEQSIRTRLEAVEAERRGHLDRLPAPTRQRYERIHSSREGRAVVSIMKGACGGCYRNQPPQVLNEAKRGDRLLLCDGCGRLMVWPPDAP
jgi:predicted  nucleic acid-binding Zn-ribbon protein